VKLSLIALINIKSPQKEGIKLSPFKMLYGKSFPGRASSKPHPDVESELTIKHPSIWVCFHSYGPGDWLHLNPEVRGTLEAA
jgi:hypothetical protein